MKRTTSSAAALFSGLALLTLSACGGSGSGDSPGPGPEPQGLLRPVASSAELENSLKAGFTIVQTAPEGGLALSASDGAFTGTYTVEQNVDEFDSVKYDGTHLYVAPTRGHFGCCFVLANDAPVTQPPERRIRILQTDPASAGATEVGEITLEDNVSVQGMYVVGDRLIALTAEAFFGHFGDAWASLSIWAPETTGLRVYDTSDLSDPALQFDATFDGHFIDSRRVGNTVYVITRYTPFLDNVVPWVMTPAEADANRAVLANVELDELLPTVTVNGTTRNLIDPDRCYLTNDDSDAGYPVLTSITAVPIDNPTAFETTCYNEDAYGTYVSESAVYLTQGRYDAVNDTQQTRIHKFALGGGAPSYSGSADVDGSVWTGGQADFRLNEHQGDLRVFTSEFGSSSDDFVDHRLFVLREDSAAPQLNVIGALPNDTRPEEIGKPNEQLFGVRFLGERAYAVTFEQIDPLYAFDLSDPADPLVAGTLEVAGVSDFLHPVSDDLLLGLGRAANGGIKLELFDVSTLDQPLSVGSDIVGGAGSSSEALWNRHAFTYLAGADIDRFALPVEATAEDGSFSLVESSLRLYEIRDKATPQLATLQPAGSMIVDGNQFGYPLRSRSVFHDDAVYYVRDENVFSALWGAAAVINGPH